MPLPASVCRHTRRSSKHAGSKALTSKGTVLLQSLRVQVYGGLVEMDFNKQHMEATGRGLYRSLDPGLLPRLWLVWCDNPSDSGRVHSSVKQRWLAGDADLLDGMARVADCAAQGRWGPLGCCRRRGSGAHSIRMPVRLRSSHKLSLTCCCCCCCSRLALQQRDVAKLAQLMDSNFDLRR